jgi:hypothetical protein
LLILVLLNDAHSGQIANGGLILSPGGATLRVNKPVIPLRASNAYSTGERRDPVRGCRGLEKVAERRNEGSVAVIVARKSIHQPFGTENDIGVNLIVVPDLAAADKCATGPAAKIGTV